MKQCGRNSRQVARKLLALLCAFMLCMQTVPAAWALPDAEPSENAIEQTDGSSQDTAGVASAASEGLVQDAPAAIEESASLDVAAPAPSSAPSTSPATVENVTTSDSADDSSNAADLDSVASAATSVEDDHQEATSEEQFEDTAKESSDFPADTTGAEVENDKEQSGDSASSAADGAVESELAASDTSSKDNANNPASEQTDTAEDDAAKGQQDAKLRAQPATPSTTAAQTSVQAGSLPATTLEAQSEEPQAAQRAPIVLQSNLPASYDARSQNLITPVRLQDPWGACWAFGSLAAMEANLVKQGIIDNNTHLSARHLIYFAGTPAANNGAQAGEGQYVIDVLKQIYGENAVFEMGGHAQEVASAISSGEGVVLEQDFPYENDEWYLAPTGGGYSSDGTWSLPESDRYKASFTLRNMNRLENPSTYAETGDLETPQLNAAALDNVKQAILDYGAVSASYNSFSGMAVDTSHYDARYATYFTNESTAIDHDVCIVGWDDNFPRERFTTGKDATLPEGNGAWIVKNSWGAANREFPDENDWGKDGYCYISYYDRSIQGFTAWDMMSVDDSDATELTNQHDYMGQRSNADTRVTLAQPQSFANTFVADVAQKVRAVSVNTYAQRTQVDVVLYLLDSDALTVDADPTRGMDFARKSVVLEHAGYHRIQLDDYFIIYPDERFSVVVSMVEVDEDGNRVYVASIEAGNSQSMVERYGLTHQDTVICNPGETQVLVTIDGVTKWIDGTEYAAMLQKADADGAHYGNACIKVFADPLYPLPPDDDPPISDDPIDVPVPDNPIVPVGPEDPIDSDNVIDNAEDGRTPSEVRGLAVANVQAAPVAWAPLAQPSVLAKTADQSAGLVIFLLVVLVISGIGAAAGIRFGAFRDRA